MRIACLRKMNKNLLSIMLAAHVGAALAAEELDGVGNKRLPSGAVLMCEEHVVAEASGKPVHIGWQAYGLNSGTEKAAQFYASQFALPPTQGHDAHSYTWTFKGKYSELRYSVQSPSVAGPWSGCAIQPSGFQSIILISNAIR